MTTNVLQQAGQDAGLREVDLSDPNLTKFCAALFALGQELAGEARMTGPTVVLKPKGRGRWNVMTMRLDGERGGLLIRVGQLLTLGGVVWRICEVKQC